MPPASYRILIVDDEPLIRRLFVRNFSRKGFQVLSAPDGKEALETIRRERPDLVVLDVRMPVMDGIEVLQSFAKANQKMTIIVLTAYDDFQPRAAELGAVECITKPFDLDYLETRIMTHLMMKPA